MPQQIFCKCRTIVQCHAMVMRFLLCLATLALSAAAAPPLKVRGALPWHNFLEGPTAWDEEDWERYLDRMKELDLNLLTLHCYTGGSERYVSYVEPMIRIEYRGVLPEAGFDTSLTARWGYRPLAVKDFAFDTRKLFKLPTGVEAFGARNAVLARTNRERYDGAQALIRRVFQMAHQRGIQTAMGFEFGVYPPELFSVAPQASFVRGTVLPDPTHAASIEILKITIDNILEAYPGVDQIWLWLQELKNPAAQLQLSPAFQGLMKRDGALFAGSSQTAFTGVWALAYIRAAHAYLKERSPGTRLAVSGWGGEEQLTGILGGLDRGLPRDIILTCLNPRGGAARQPEVMARIAKNRQAWPIPWLESDERLWHPQPRVALMRDHVGVAREQGSDGAVCIHWRTEETRANMEAFARYAGGAASLPSTGAFYDDFCRREYGPRAGAELAKLLTRMEEESWFSVLSSPVYHPYHPNWGRMKPELRRKVADALETVERLEPSANLHSLAAGLRFTLQLDDVSAAMEPAYALKEKTTLGKAAPAEYAAARKALAAAPMEALFRTYTGRVRSRGELGVLSSLNQRVWTQYAELQAFLARGPR
ncbi:MAG TPA: hypothetical protein VN442_04585 [Bryobacteraceae bacterium]|nr:hypothetical protein [Bryobacteraceae bacterium]